MYGRMCSGAGPTWVSAENAISGVSSVMRPFDHAPRRRSTLLGGVQIRAWSEPCPISTMKRSSLPGMSRLAVL